MALFSLQLTAQIHVDNQWKNIINPIFDNLDKSKIQSGILLDYAMEFTDVTAYNGVTTDTTYIDANIMGNIYKTLFMGKVVADTTHTPLFDRHAYNWARDRFNATKDSTGVYVLSGLLYEYQTLDEDALAQNRITVSNSKYYDKYTNGVWQNPYETKQTFALTPPVLHSRSRDVYFKLPDELFLSNIGSQIASIQLDVDNGQGFQNLPFDMAVPLRFYENKIHDLTFKLTLTNNSTLYCRSKFKVDDPVLKQPQQLARGSIQVDDERVYIYEDGHFFNAAWLTIRRRQDNLQSGNITRPLIIAEGLDAGNFTAPEDFGGETTLENFDNDVLRSNSDLIDLLQGNTQDYDLIYIDWVRGMADLRDNSRVLEEVLEWVNSQKVPLNGVTEQNVLLGQSMGGVIGRYTLARMENNNIPHDVRLFVAHDSPMQGANTLLAGQHFSAHMREEYVSVPLAWTVGEVLIPIAQGLAELSSAFLNAFGANTSVPAYVTPTQLLSLQDQTAARQLNYWSVVTDINNNHQQTRSFNQAWQQTLENEGWPTQSRNIAISNGNECSTDNGFAPGAQLIDIDSRSNPGFLLDMLNAVLAPVAGAVTLDLGLVLVGAIPGRSRWETKFDFNSYGITGSQNRIYRGRLRFKKKILWIGPTVTHDVFNRSYYAPNTALPYDTYSGGRFEFFDGDGDFAFEDVPILADLMEVQQDFFGFIPVVSALDIKKSNGNDPTPDDYLKSYSGGVPQDTNLESGFDAFIVDNQPNQPFNNEHISFQVRNGDWLAAELEANQPGNTFPVLPDCSWVCDPSAPVISGPQGVCGTSSYYIDAPSVNVTWSVRDRENLTDHTISNGVITLTQNGSNDIGYIDITAFYGNDNCGTATTSRRVWVGRPSVYTWNPDYTKNYMGGSFSFQKSHGAYGSFSAFADSPNTTLNWGGPNNVTWYNINSNTVEISLSNTGTYFFNAAGQNSCSTHPYFIAVTISDNGGGGFQNFRVTRNPIDGTEITVVEILEGDILAVEQTKDKTKKGDYVYLELYDLMGNLVKSAKLKYDKEKNRYNLNTGKLDGQTYFIRIVSGEVNEVYQIIVK